MTKLNPKDLKKRFDQAERQKAHWRAIYEDAYRYALPNKNLYDGYYEGSVPGQNKMRPAPVIILSFSLFVSILPVSALTLEETLIISLFI